MPTYLFILPFIVVERRPSGYVLPRIVIHLLYVPAIRFEQPR